MVFIESLSAQHRVWLKEVAALEEQSSEEEEAEESVAVQSGAESQDDPLADDDSLGEKSIASVAATVLSDPSIPLLLEDVGQTGPRSE